MKRLLIASLVALSITGCASAQIKTPKAVILQEDRIYTLPAGETASVTVDGKPQTVTFNQDMKIVSADNLVREEQQLNEKELKKAKIATNRNKTMGIVGSILALLAGGVGWFIKQKKEAK
jgi:uncharacterized protein YcfL